MHRSVPLAIVLSMALSLFGVTNVLAHEGDGDEKIMVEPSSLTAGSTTILAGSGLEPDNERVLVLAGQDLVELGSEAKCRDAGKLRGPDLGDQPRLLPVMDDQPECFARLVRDLHPDPRGFEGIPGPGHERQIRLGCGAARRRENGLSGLALAGRQDAAHGSGQCAGGSARDGL